MGRQEGYLYILTERGRGIVIGLDGGGALRAELHDHGVEVVFRGPGNWPLKDCLRRRGTQIDHTGYCCGGTAHAP